MAAAKRIMTVVGATALKGAFTQKQAQEYTIRAVAQSPDSAAAKLAARGIQADLNDGAALRAAFAGSYAVFAVINVWGLFMDAQKELSTDQGVSLVADKVAAMESDMGINMASAVLTTDTL
ncbi:LOW QUALITY PROTEIN: hypothetical protein MKX08_009442 [Trichoderma sp. CBMAI-0020]|nr:LOW QUALITY PROTEIN: hypothetical protein MKX08_009442 [Trichoderma sp. CBMAI-0020]